LAKIELFLKNAKGLPYKSDPASFSSKLKMGKKGGNCELFSKCLTKIGTIGNRAFV